MMFSTHLIIEQDEKSGCTTISNDSDYTIEISAVPKKGKRKIYLIDIIGPKQFMLLSEVYKFNINDYYFRFV